MALAEMKGMLDVLASREETEVRATISALFIRVKAGLR